MQGSSCPGAVLDGFVRLQAGTVTADMIKQWKEHFEGQNVINGQCRGGGVTSQTTKEWEAGLSRCEDTLKDNMPSLKYAKLEDSFKVFALAVVTKVVSAKY